MTDAEEPKTKESHTLADHVYGLDLAHTHDGYADHDHDFPDDGPLGENPIWIADHVSLMTVGIDIGSSGTQVIFSRVNLRRLGEDLSSRYFVVSRETLFQSSVALTPYRSEEHIDEAKLGAIIDDAYNAAGIDPAGIDTGAVILTGEALRRENAKAIAAIVAEKGGDFVCATAGHHMESMLAAYGSGAATVSSAEGKRILNIDVGGGTTTGSVVGHGKVVATAAVHIGGRLQVVDHDSLIVRLDPAGKYHAKRAGFAWNPGDVADAADLDKVADGMADALVAALAGRPLPHDIAHLYLTDPIADFGPIDGSCSPAASASMSMAARTAILPTSGEGSAMPSAGASTQVRCTGRCCRPANASARPRSAPRNTRSSCPAIPAISRYPAPCCRGAISRCYNRIICLPI